jgi:hypothetical protein
MRLAQRVCQGNSIETRRVFLQRDVETAADGINI